ncbi:MAG: hypothetical protein Q4G02_01380 [bacterium]|nr:hypothetical protein [bacterium]
MNEIFERFFVKKFFLIFLLVLSFVLPSAIKAAVSTDYCRCDDIGGIPTYCIYLADSYSQVYNQVNTDCSTRATTNINGVETSYPYGNVCGVGVPGMEMYQNVRFMYNKYSTRGGVPHCTGGVIGYECPQYCKYYCSGGVAVSCYRGNKCGNNITCYGPHTCATLGYYSDANTASKNCELGYDQKTVSNGCGGTLSCYVCRTCTTCEGITDDGGGWITAEPTCTETGGYKSKEFENICGGTITCYKKTKKTCSDYGYLSSPGSCGGTFSSIPNLSDGCNKNLTCYQCCNSAANQCNCNTNGGETLNSNDCTQGGGVASSRQITDTCTGETKTCYKCNKCNPADNVYETCKRYNADGSIANNYSCKDTSYVNSCGKTIACHERKTCQEMEPSKKTQSECTNGQIFVHIDDGCAAYDINQPCGQCTDVSSNWLQGINGNFYAQGKVDMTISSTITYYYMQGEGNNQTVAENTIDNVFDNKFLLRHNGAFNANKNISSSLAIIGGNNLVLNNMDVTQREVSNTQAASTLGSPSNRKEDFAYFQNLVAYDKLATCNTDLNNGSSIDGTLVCKIGSADTTTNLSNITIADGVKQVVFVDGNLTINGDIAVPETSYLAVIVNKNITFNPNLGTDVTTFANPQSSWDQAPAVNGVFIASGELLFPANTEKSLYTKYPCDTKLTLGGTFVGWGGVEVQRSFIGCATAAPSLTTPYQNYNAKIPVLTFKYRPEFVLNTPSWMKQVTELTLESN